MKFGLSEEQYQLVEKLLFSPLKDKSARVYVFGSRASGKNHKFSDLDVLYKPNAKSLIAGAFISEIKEKLENSKLPFKVDLVMVDDLAQSYRDKVFEEMIEV